MLAALASAKDGLEKQGVVPVIVHMSSTERGREVFSQYGLESCRQISDPQRNIYKMVGLKRGGFSEVFSPSVFKRAFEASKDGFKIGKLEGDGFQLQGAAIISKGQIVDVLAPEHAGETIDFLDFAKKTL